MGTAGEVLAAGLAELGLAEAALPGLTELADLLAAWAPRLNLTAHRGAEAIASRLILDAVALATQIPGAPPASVADLGSGAGIPGLPLAVLWPDCRITLVEARERRHHFQRTAIRTLRLPNATAKLGRVEELPSEAHSVVVAQAVAPPAKALEWMARWAGPESWLVLPQSEDQPAFDPPPMVFHVETRSYRVPIAGTNRRVWLGRIAPRLPRSAGV
jgi:16S rRNA (guanine527-N7)-methyltransferase